MAGKRERIIDRFKKGGKNMKKYISIILTISLVLVSVFYY